ncbi:hypothetical protein HLH26_15770 [Gluconacetobacter sp. 1b LMG 1731]|uniref:Uncharacterized protein n=1 Tax=Gluconacetobacter dulcium TaxID=2729096 RepID=A0A7W4IN61_9PROT|nr:hypothetical protein [Gluconacetobacter dulcium]MBB2195098.1 hypothetical protein [Gluconacetobacter dulcium]
MVEIHRLQGSLARVLCGLIDQNLPHGLLDQVLESDFESGGEGESGHTASPADGAEASTLFITKATSFSA